MAATTEDTTHHYHYVVDEKNPNVLAPIETEFQGSDAKEKELEAAHYHHNDQKQEEPTVIIPTANGHVVESAPPTTAAASSASPLSSAPPTSAFVEHHDPDAPLTTSPVDVKRHATGTFAAGPGTSGPENGNLDTLHERANTADSQLSPTTKAKITKAESRRNNKSSQDVCYLLTLHL